MPSQHKTEEVLKIAEDIARENGDFLVAAVLSALREGDYTLNDYDTWAGPRRPVQMLQVEFDFLAEDVPDAYADEEDEEEGEE